MNLRTLLYFQLEYWIRVARNDKVDKWKPQFRCVRATILLKRPMIFELKTMTWVGNAFISLVVR